MTTMEIHAGKVEAHLANWTAQIDELSSHGADYGPNAKAEYQQQMDALRALKTTIETGLQSLKTAGPDKWQSYRARVDKACSELEAALEKLVKKKS